MVHYPLNHQGMAWYGTVWYGNARTIVRWYSTCTAWCCTGWLSVLRCQQWPARRVNYVALVPPRSRQIFEIATSGGDVMHAQSALTI